MRALDQQRESRVRDATSAREVTRGKDDERRSGDDNTSHHLSHSLPSSAGWPSRAKRRRVLSDRGPVHSKRLALSDVLIEVGRTSSCPGCPRNHEDQSSAGDPISFMAAESRPRSRRRPAARPGGSEPSPTFNSSGPTQASPAPIFGQRRAAGQGRPPRHEQPGPENRRVPHHNPCDGPEEGCGIGANSAQCANACRAQAPAHEP